MQFLGVGWQEIALIMVVALVVVGPERLPNVAYQIGKAVRTMQSYARAVRSEFSEEIGYIEEQYKTVKGEMSEASQALRVEQQKFASEMRSVTAEVQSQVQDVTHLAHANVVNIDGSPVNQSPALASVYAPGAFDTSALPNLPSLPPASAGPASSPPATPAPYVGAGAVPPAAPPPPLVF